MLMIFLLINRDFSEVDGTLVCFKVATIPQTYGIKQKPPVASQM
jgi:hypothetical protein